MADQRDPQMVELGSLRSEVADHTAKAAAAGQLGERHGDELRPARHFSQSPTFTLLIC